MPDFLLYSYGFIFASSLASFYTLVAERILIYFYSIERKRYNFKEKLYHVLINPSHCTHCSFKIKPLYLIPIFGFFLTKRKCSNCKIQISWKYPTLELSYGLIFIVFYYLTQNLQFSILIIFLLGHLMISIHTDYHKFSLDYENLIFILIFGVLSNIVYKSSFPILEDYLVGLGFFTFYFLLWYLFKRGVGFGDVLFAPVYAFIVGHPWWMFYLNSSYILAITVTILNRKSFKQIRKVPIPMGVYLSIGLFLTLLGRAIFDKYLYY